MVLKRNKKFLCSIFQDVSFQKQLQQPLCKSNLLKNSAKMCLMDKSKMPLSLEVLDTAVLELWPII